MLLCVVSVVVQARTCEGTAGGPGCEADAKQSIRPAGHLTPALSQRIGHPGNTPVTTQGRSTADRTHFTSPPSRLSITGRTRHAQGRQSHLFYNVVCVH
jgi:hypothetical protein